MNLSAAGENFLKHAEGWSATCYPDAGHWAIGWGCQVDLAEYQGVTLTPEQGEVLFQAKLAPVEAAVNSHVKLSLAQWQFDSLVFWLYNVGWPELAGSTLLRLLNAGSLPEAADQFLRWDYCQGKACDSLLQRRILERRIFLGQKVDHYA